MVKRLLAAVAVLAVTVVVGMTFGAEKPSPSFSTLKTECLIDSSEEKARYTVEKGVLSFEGHFPVGGAHSELDYTYRQDGGSIVFGLNSSSVRRHTDFSGTCLSSAVYEATTPRIDSGRYLLQIRHNGALREEAYIRIDG
jgi:hypothetical protein